MNSDVILVKSSGIKRLYIAYLLCSEYKIPFLKNVMKKRKMKDCLLLMFLYAGLIFQETKTNFKSSCCMLMMMREVRGIWNFGVLLLRIFFCACAVDRMFVRENILAVSSIAAFFMSTEFEERFSMLVP